MAGQQSSWFQDEGVLLAELKKSAITDAAPLIPGYDHIRELARGGQGVVYAATQRSTRRNVAIKVLLDGALASGAARRRFEREVDVVASLKHPGIVAIYDSGVTPDGRLYFVMEHVAGKPLDEALDTVGKPAGDLRGALALIADVCDAVHYAHQRGVIHRDLKPSNIRVDDERRPRILDFGLAKATASELAATLGAPTVSMAGHFMGSLPWASPEQAVGDPDRVDLRTDVYALGVMLYQVVAGRFPYDVAGGLKTTLDHIAGTEPQSPRQVRADIPEDLATIALKALAKDPARRYQSAGELAADLRHFLQGEPIAARRESTWYTLSRTLRRYRIAAGAAAVVFLATLVALIVSVRSLAEARVQRDRAEAQTTVANEQRGIAESRTAAARAVTSFLGDMLMAADPGSRGKDLKLVEFLAPAARDAGERFKDQPEPLVSIRSYLSTAYRNLQMYDQSLEQANLGLAIAEKSLERTNREFITLRISLASTLVDMDKADQARPHAQSAVDDTIASAGKDSELYIEALSVLAYVNERSGQTAAAEAQRRELVDATSKRFGPESSEALSALGNLGATLHTLGRLDEAIPVLEQTIERARKKLGPDHIATLAPLSTLVSAYGAKGQREKSLPLLKEGWERMSARYGPESANALTFANNYAVALHNMGRSAEAKPIAEQVLAGFTKTFGPDHISVLRSMTLLGSIYGKTGENDKQIEMQKQALDIADRTMGSKQQIWHYLINNYAQALGASGRYDESIAQFQRSMPIVDEVFGEKHSMPSTIWYNLAVVMRKAGRATSETIPLLERASERFLATLGPESDWTTDCIKELQSVLKESGRGADAAVWDARLESARASSRP